MQKKGLWAFGIGAVVVVLAFLLYTYWPQPPVAPEAPAPPAVPAPAPGVEKPPPPPGVVGKIPPSEPAPPPAPGAPPAVKEGVPPPGVTPPPTTVAPAPTVTPPPPAPPPPTAVEEPPPAKPEEQYGFQVGAYKSYPHARRIIDELQRHGMTGFIRTHPDKPKPFQVWAGPFPSEDQAKEAADRLIKAKFIKGARVQKITEPRK